ncbi:MAG: tetratricopeptide repeat protein [Acidimicrobiia bacterium]|nr:tetratricopeptide repeat protein [Acidimicrobiia bacterium]
MTRQAWLVAAVVVGLYGGLVAAPFAYDDHGLPGSGLTRPLTYWSFLGNAALDEGPAGYHAVNIALHLACSLLLFAVLRRLVPEAALVAALLFAVHPLSVEPVAYVFARGTPLAAMFCLVALLLWVKGRHWWAVGAFALALLGKEECAAFPAFLAMLHLSVSRNVKERWPIAAMFALAVAAVGRVAVVASMTEGSGAGAQAGVGWWEYFLTQGTVIPRYLRMLAAPYGLSVDPPVVVSTGWMSWAGWLGVLGACAAAACCFDKAREGFWFLGGMVLLLPTSSIFPAADLAADRRMYLPMVAFSVLCAMLVKKRQLGFACVAVLAVVSYQRTQVWKSERALWEDALEKAPGKPRPRLQLARVSEPARALQLLEEAQRMAPENAQVASERGRHFLAQGDAARALQAFGRAVALTPSEAAAYGNRGVALWALGLKQEALADFERAIELDPCQREARENLRKLGIEPGKPCQR